MLCGGGGLTHKMVIRATPMRSRRQPSHANASKHPPVYPYRSWGRASVVASAVMNTCSGASASRMTASKTRTKGPSAASCGLAGRRSLCVD